MRRIASLSIIFLLSFFIAGSATSKFHHAIKNLAHSSVQKVALNKKELLTIHNKERSKYNKSLFTIGNNLSLAAQKHADWMAKNKTLSHTGSNGSNLKDRVGQGYMIYGENIASGQKNEKEVIRAWMKSSGHRKNILNNYFKYVGFGISKSKDGTIYWCVVFGG